MGTTLIICLRFYYIVKNKLLHCSKSKSGRIILIITFSLITLRILFWLFFKSTSSEEYIKTSSLHECLDDRVRIFINKFSQINAVEFPGVVASHHAYSDERQHMNQRKVSSKYFLPFVGNGYIGTSWDYDSRLYLNPKNFLSYAVDFYPIIALRLPDDYISQESFVMDFLDGMVYKLQCFKKTSLCISAGTMIYAHRTIPGHFQQNIRIYNPTAETVEFKLTKLGMSKWSDAFLNSFNVDSARVDESGARLSIAYNIISGVVELPEDQRRLNQEKRFIHLAIAEPNYPESIIVPKSKTVTYTFTTVIQYTEAMTYEESRDITHRTRVETQARQLVEYLNQQDELQLRGFHTNTWNKLWESGIYISQSLAPDAVNGDQINSTLYYLMSQTPAPLYMHDITLKPSLNKTLSFRKHSREYYRKKLALTDRCYDGHNTLNIAALWQPVETSKALLILIDTWMITLEKQGCGQLLQAGVNGISQAVLLSTGAFGHSGQHLQFSMQPSDLHRDITFRNIQFRDLAVWISVAIMIDENNKPTMMISSQADRSIYVCDAGCLDTPFIIKESPTYVPVKVTDPRTPLLYITDQREHILELKHAIHVISIEDAPAHRHDIIALHRHGHALGGLPTLFWVTFILLITLFHLFLCKIIYSELCKASYDSKLTNNSGVKRQSFRNEVMNSRYNV